MIWLRRAVTGSIVVALAAVGLVGCGTSSPSDRARPVRLYPFESAVYYTDAEQRIITEKLERATADCMRSRGFSYPSASASASAEASQPEPEPNNAYGLLDLATARVSGYDIVPAEIRRRTRVGSPATPTSEPKYTAALVGDQQRQRELSLPDGSRVSVATDGCVALSRETVFGSGWDRMYYTVQALSNMVIERTGVDPAVVTALSAWSSCMGDAGHPAKNPEQLYESLLSRARAATDDDALRAVARAELTTAEADATCQDRVKLAQVTRDAQHRAEREVLNEQTGRDLEQLRLRRRAVLGH